MAITAAKRASLSPGQFGLPKQKKYALDTVKRAKNAKARDAQQVGKSITPAQKMQIDRKANTVIRKAGGNPTPPTGKPQSGAGSAGAMPKPKENPMHRNPKPMGATRQVNKFFSGD